MSATQSWSMPRQHHLARQVRIHRQIVIGIGGHHELPFAQAQQIVLAHDPLDPFVVHLPAAALQLRA